MARTGLSLADRPRPRPRGRTPDGQRTRRAGAAGSKHGRRRQQPVADKTTAAWILQLVGIGVTRCPRCGSQAVQRTELPPLQSPGIKPEPALRDTS